MGLQPKATEAYVVDALERWKHERDVLTLFKDFWFPLEDRIHLQLAKLLGAASTQELCLVSSLTVNLHSVLATFYRPLETRRDKIIMLAPEFNSDVFAVEGWLELYQRKDALIRVPVEDTALANDLIVKEVERSKDVAGVLCMSAVSYVTGQFYDIKRIAECCRKNNVHLVLQLAHAMGAVELQLHDWGVDCAVWCSYKYMNCLMGAIGGIFIHERHFDKMPGLRGWFGTDKQV